MLARLRVLSFFLLTFTFSLSLSATALANQIDGVVVDQAGRPVPRAHVRVIDESGAERTGGFADDSGHFVFHADLTECQLEVSLTGFQTGRVRWVQGEAARVVLRVAPVAENVIVSATRTAAPTSQAGASATIFTSDDLERLQTPLMADLLTMTPGAMLVRSGGPGTVTSLFVRGGESDYNKVLLDGIPLNEPGGTYFFSNLTTENLERVEVVRGAYSSLFGSDAMSSVIQLFSKRGAARRPAVSAQLDGGTYGTMHASGNVSGATDKVDYSVGGARFTSDNRVPNSALDNNTFNANLGVSLGSTASLRFIGRSEREHVGTPGPTAFGRADSDAFFERDDNVEGVSFDQEAGILHQHASYSRSASDQQSTDAVVDPPYRATFEGLTATRLTNDFTGSSLTKLRRHHASYQADLRLSSGGSAGTQLLTLLGDFDGERSDATSSFGDPAVNSRNNFGFSVQDQMLWRRVFVTLGGRVERNDSFGTAAVPRATVVFVAHQPSSVLGATNLKVNAGAGIKEPTMLESFSPSPFFHGNPDLKPERSRSVEFGVEQRFAADRAKLGLTYFYSRYQDVITLITDPATFFATYENVGLTRGRGVELGFEAAPVAALQFHVSYTYLDSKVLASDRPDDILFGLGKPLLRRPKNSGNAGVSLIWSRLNADLTGVFVGEFSDSDFGVFSPSFTTNPGHDIWNARFEVKATKQVSGVMTIDNLANKDYSEPLGYQPLLRVVRGGIRVGF